MTVAGQRGLLGRGIAFPPRIGQDGRWLFSEGAENVSEAIRIILLTNLKERIRLPEFGGGLRDFLFDPNTVSTRRLIQERITQALGQWEPRIRIVMLSVDPDPEDQQSAIVSLTFKLPGERSHDSLSLRIALNGGA